MLYIPEPRTKPEFGVTVAKTHIDVPGEAELVFGHFGFDGIFSFIELIY